MSLPLVSLFRTPRTGSTLVKRCLMIVAEFPKKESNHEAFNPTAPLIVTVRDWRDVLYSRWRIEYGHVSDEPSKQELKNAMVVVDKRLNDLDRMTDQGGYFPWRYEQTWASPYMACLYLKAIAGRELTRDEMAQVSTIVNPEIIEAIQDSLPESETGKPFDVHCKQTGIHKNHMGPLQGRPGAWRDAIPVDLHSWVTDHYELQLKKWGYEL